MDVKLKELRKSGRRTMDLADKIVKERDTLREQVEALKCQCELEATNGHSLLETIKELEQRLAERPLAVPAEMIEEVALIVHAHLSGTKPIADNIMEVVKSRLKAIKPKLATTQKVIDVIDELAKIWSHDKSLFIHEIKVRLEVVKPDPPADQSPDLKLFEGDELKATHPADGYYREPPAKNEAFSWGQISWELDRIEEIWREYFDHATIDPHNLREEGFKRAVQLIRTSAPDAVLMALVNELDVALEKGSGALGSGYGGMLIEIKHRIRQLSPKPVAPVDIEALIHQAWQTAENAKPPDWIKATEVDNERIWHAGRSVGTVGVSQELKRLIAERGVGASITLTPDALELLEFLAQQSCTAYDDTDCCQTQLCVTEYCYPCTGKVILRGVSKGEGASACPPIYCMYCDRELRVVHDEETRRYELTILHCCNRAREEDDCHCEEEPDAPQPQPLHDARALLVEFIEWFIKPLTSKALVGAPSVSNVDAFLAEHPQEPAAPTPDAWDIFSYIVDFGSWLWGQEDGGEAEHIQHYANAYLNNHPPPEAKPIIGLSIGQVEKAYRDNFFESPDDEDRGYEEEALKAFLERLKALPANEPPAPVASKERMLDLVGKAQSATYNGHAPGDIDDFRLGIECALLRMGSLINTANFPPEPTVAIDCACGKILHSKFTIHEPEKDLVTYCIGQHICETAEPRNKCPDRCCFTCGFWSEEGCSKKPKPDPIVWNAQAWHINYLLAGCEDDWKPIEEGERE